MNFLSKILATIILLLIIYLAYLSTIHPELPWATPAETWKANRTTLMIIDKGPIFPNEEGYAKLARADDPIGLRLYESLRRHGPVCKVWVAGQVVYAITDFRLVRWVLEHSPKLFGPGRFKKNLFSHFMPNNIGINDFPQWSFNRPINEKMLGFRDFSGTHPMQQLLVGKVENCMEFLLPSPGEVAKHTLHGRDFASFGKFLAFATVFGDHWAKGEYYWLYFNLLEELQSFRAVYGINPVRKSTKEAYANFVRKRYESPDSDSMLFYLKAIFGKDPQGNEAKLICKGTKCMEPLGKNLVDQLPHWLFPIHNVMNIPVPIFFALMDAHPDKKRRVLAEIREGFDLYSPRTYLHYCVTECLRLYGIVTTLLRTVVYDDTCLPKVDGKRLTFFRGDQLMMASIFLTHNKECFPDYQKFRPERWRDFEVDGRCDITFNLGPQMCAGADFGRVLMKKFIAEMYTQWDVRTMAPQLDPGRLPEIIDPWEIRLEMTPAKKL